MKSSTPTKLSKNIAYSKLKVERDQESTVVMIQLLWYCTHHTTSCTQSMLAGWRPYINSVGTSGKDGRS